VKHLLVIVVALLLAGCGSKGYIRADAIDGLVEKVTVRHDALLKGELDPKDISAEDKATFLRSAELLRQAVKEAQK
jgi:hypothetical protein